MLDISVIVPAYNERESLPSTVQEILEVCASAGVSIEMIIVDDGSVDGTSEVAQELGKHVAVKVVGLPTNMGMGSAMRRGTNMASGTWICFLPGDGQFSPTEMLRLYENREGMDAVAGEVSMSNRGKADSIVRVFLSRTMRLLMKLTHPKMPSFNGILLVRRDLVAELPLIGRTGFVHMEILDRLRRDKEGFRLKYCAITVRARISGSSKTANVKGMRALLFDMIRLRADYWGLVQ